MIDAISYIAVIGSLLLTLTLIPVLHDAHLGLWTLIAAVAAVIAGHAIGSRLFARMTPGHFDVLMLSITLATGATSVVLGLSSI